MGWKQTSWQCRENTGLTLEGGDFAGAVVTQTLQLRHSNLATLPDGLFRGIVFKRAIPVALDLTDNPGAPFALPAVLEPAGKVDGVAQVRLRLPAGSLFPMEFDVSAVNAEVFPSRLSIAQGAETSALAAVVSDGGGPMTVTWSAPAVPVQWKGVSGFAAQAPLELPSPPRRPWFFGTKAAGDSVSLTAQYSVPPLPTGSEYRLSDDGGVTWSDWAAFDDSLVALSKHTVTGLRVGVTYLVEARGVNAEGPGVAARREFTTIGLQPVSVPDLYWTRGQRKAFALPEAQGGSLPYTYALEGGLPAGLSFDLATRVLSGTPPASAPAVKLTWRVEDAAGVVRTAKFSLTVLASDNTRPRALASDGNTEQGVLLIGRLDLGKTGEGVLYTARSLTMPRAKPWYRGKAPLFADPDGDALTIRFSDEGLPDNMRPFGDGLRTLSTSSDNRDVDVIGVSIATADRRTEGTVTVTAHDGRGGRVSRPLTVIGHPPADAAQPAFAPGESIPELRLEAEAEMEPVELPAASGGDLPAGGVFGHRYSTSVLPLGLSFDSATRMLSGTPAAGTAGVHVVEYRADDRDAVEERADAAFLRFAVRVSAGVCGRPAAVRDALVGASGAADCAAVSASRLAAVEALDLGGAGLVRLRAADLAGLSGLRRLDLSDNRGLRIDEDLFDGMRELRVLVLDGLGLAALPAGLARRAPALEELSLSRNRLRLSAGMFAGFDRVRRLTLEAIGAATLPDDVFLDLGALRHVDLGGNALSLIDAAPFAASESGGLPGRIETLSLRDNRISRLHDLHLRRFTGMRELDLSGNRLESLPGGTFGAMSGLRSLDLRDNPGTPFAERLALESNGDGMALRARLAAGGLPFETAVTFSAGRASLSASGVTISPAAQFSEWVTVTPDGTGDVTIVTTSAEIVTGSVHGIEVATDGATMFYSVPGEPTVNVIAGDAGVTLSWPADVGGSAPVSIWQYRVSRDGGTSWMPDWTAVPNHSGPENLRVSGLANGTEHVFEVRAVSVVGHGAAGRAVATPTAPEGVCGRTEQVKDAIVAALSVESCGAARLSHLADIEALDLSAENVAALSSGDFADLTALATLDLGGNDLSALPAGVFTGLTALATLDLGGNDLSALPAGVFTGLTALATLDLGGNDLSALPAGVFTGLTALATLDLGGNDLSALPAGVFTGLTALAALDLGGNDLSALPAGVFTGLTALATLDLGGNDLSALPAGVFTGLTALATLDLSGNTTDPLPLDVTLHAVADAVGQVRVDIAQGAPVAITVPLTATNAALSADSATVAAGSRTSLPVVLTPNEDGPASAALGTPMPELPAGFTSLTLNAGAALELLFPPSAPGVTATAAHREAGLTWTAGFDGGAAVTGWQIRHRADGDEWGEWQQYADATPPAKYTVTDLDNGTTYEFEVRAVRGDQFGAAGQATATPVAANAVPVFTDVAPVTRSLEENTVAGTALGAPIAAIDAGDGGEEVPTLTYALSGTDADRFAIDGATGQITVADDAVLDFETRPTLEVVVDVHDGRDEGGAVEATPGVDASMPVTINLADVEEPPDRPRIPTAKALSHTAVQVTWDAPANTGPPIIDYDVRFRDVLGEEFVDAGHDGKDSVTQILGLEPVSSYLTEVRARNEEGTGLWSLGALVKTLPEPDNLTPLAVAGPDQDVLVGETTTLDGSASTDLDEHPLTWSWTQLSGATVTLDDAAAAMPSFTAPDSAGTLRFRLIVNDGRVDSPPDEIEVHVLHEAVPPRAPLQLSAQGHDRLITLKWTAGADGGAAVSAWQYRWANENQNIVNGSWSAIQGSSEATRSLRFDGVANGTRWDFQVRAVNAVGAGAASKVASATPSLPTGGICARTQTVRATIVSRLSSAEVINCGDVTQARLESLTTLSLATKGLTALKPGDLDGLTGLTFLSLKTNSLTALPAGILDDLTALTTLDLSSNGLESLDGDLFKHTTALQSLDLSNNSLDALPAGLFEGLTELASVRVAGNAGDPMSLDIELEAANDAETEIRARVVQGAPFAARVVLTAANATLGATSATVPAGQLVSPAVAITPNLTGAMEFSILSLPAVPDGFTSLKTTGVPGVALTLPAPPSSPSLTAQPGNGFVDYGWTAGDDGGAAITGWEYRYSVDGGETLTKWFSRGSAATSLRLYGANGAGQVLELRAVNARGSGAVAQATATPTADNDPPVFGEGAAATRTVSENSTVTDSGDPVPVGDPVAAEDPDADDMLVYALVTTDDATADDAEAFALDTETGQLTVAAGADLDYERQESYTLSMTVTDNRDEHNRPDGRVVDATIAVTIDIDDVDEPPATPTGLAVSSLSSSHLTVTWEPSTTTGPPVSRYDLDYRMVGEEAYATEVLDGTTTNLSLLSLNPLAPYEFRVRAANDEGESGWSANITGTTLANVPSAPSELSATAAAAAVDLAWVAGADGGAAIDLWQYRYSADGGETWEEWTDIADSDETTATHSVSSLSHGFAWSFQVRARNSTGFGATSPVATVVFGNRAPVFAGGALATRSVAENAPEGARIGLPVAAQDADEDTLTYTLTGTDATKFAIDSAGQVTVGSGTDLDYETATTHEFTVNVSDGKAASGAEDAAVDASVAVTVQVIDVPPPGAPGGLTATSPHPMKLAVRWSVPQGATPTHHVVRYREESCTTAGCWSSDSTVQGTGTTLTGLTHATSYEVAVEAHNQEGFASATVVAGTRERTAIAGVALTSDSGADTVYGIGDTVEATVTFDGRVFVGEKADPTLVLTVGDAERVATYRSGGGTPSLLFSYVVAEGDDDADGVGIAKNALRFADADLWDIAGIAPDGGHDAVTDAAMAHRVDGMRPRITGLSVTSRPFAGDTYASNEAITAKVVFDEPVFITGTPGLMLTVGDVARAAPLLLGHGTEELRFTYRVQPGDADADGISVSENALTALEGVVRDAAGNFALLTHAAMPAQAAHKVDAPANRVPVFTDGATASRTVSEGAAPGTSVGAPLVATDADPNDPVTYALSGTNARHFAIDSEGQISVGAAAMLDHERAPELTFAATATDTAGASAEIAVTVTVTDADTEVPAAPGAPAVTATAADTLVVSWAPPLNGGPAISRYDVQYRRSDVAGWTDHTSVHSATSTATTIDGLLPFTRYLARVRARNDEGIGGWSEEGSGSTGTDGNQAPAGADFTATTQEDTPHAFATDDFAFHDSDRHDALSAVRIVSIPDEAAGRLRSNGTDVAPNRLIAAGDLAALRFVPAADWNGKTVFSFKVVDAANTESVAVNTATVTVTPVNDAPFFPFSATVLQVAENSAARVAVGEPLTATDVDGDSLRYELPAPAPGEFTIDAASGQIAVGAGAALNFERQASHLVTVIADDGAETARLTVTVRVVDQDGEAPGRPAAPAVAVLDAASLQATWEPPATNPGPPLTDYDVRYRKQAETLWRAHAHAGTATSAVITGLETDADYVIQVRARNEEGAGDWSGDGQGRPVNQAPTSADFSTSTDENTTLTFAVGSFPFHDVDPGDTLFAVSILSLPPSASGSLQLDGEPLSQAQAVLTASLGGLQFVPEAGFVGHATFRFRVFDRASFVSAVHVATIAVGEVNDSPRSAPFLKHAVEDTEQSFEAGDFPFRDSDPDDALTSVRIVSLPDAGKGELQLDGVAVTASQVVAAQDMDGFVFVPAANYSGEANFRFRVADPAGSESAAHTATIAVAGVADEPESAAFRKSAVEDTPLSFSAADFPFIDPDPGDTLTSVRIVSLPDAGKGELQLDGVAVTASQVVTAAALDDLAFVPEENFIGDATFDFRVADAAGAESAIEVATVEVASVNDPPTSAAFTASTPEDTALPLTAARFAFDDPDTGDVLQAVRFTVPPAVATGSLRVGEVTVAANQRVQASSLDSLNFAPANDFAGDATLGFRVVDSAGGESADYRGLIRVAQVADRPTAANIEATTDEDTSLPFKLADFEDAYHDGDGHTLRSVTIVTLPSSAHGMLLWSPDGDGEGDAAPVTANQVIDAGDLSTLVFVPAFNYVGTATFTYRVTDASGQTSVAAATVTVTVGSVEDVPNAGEGIQKRVDEDTTLAFAASDFTDIFSDPDGHTLKSVKIVTLPDAAHGVLKIGTSAATAGQTVAVAGLGTIAFEPAANWNGTASFTFRVIDSTDRESDAATATVTVNPVDDPPTAAAIIKATAQDTALTFARSDFADVFQDVDGHTLKSVKIATLPDAMQGALKLASAAVTAGREIAVTDLGTLRFVPAPAYLGTGSFTFRVIDSADDESTAAYEVSVVVSSGNNLPTAGDIARTVDENTTLTFAQTDFTSVFNDVDGHTLKSVKIVTLPDTAHGKLTVGTDDPPADVQADDAVALADLGTLKFVPVASWSGSAGFTFRVVDISDEQSALAYRVTITVNAANDLPASSDIAKTTDEDTTLAFAASDFTDAFSDADGHTLKSVKVATPPDAGHGVLKVGALTATAGWVVAAADLGTIKFEPVANWNGTASFTFKVTDSSDEESAAPATASITVNAVNDLPASSDIAKTTGEDTTLTFAASDFTDAFSDADGHTLKSVKVVTLPDAAHGVLTVGAADPPAKVQAGGVIAVADLGTLKFEPVANWNGSASFTFRVTDSSDEESAAPATVAITVNAVDDLPASSDIAKTTGEDTTLAFAASDFTDAFSDVDGHTLKSVKVVTLPNAAHGVLTVGAANPPAKVQAGGVIAAADLGTLKFEPVANWNGSASFTFRVTDSSDGESAASATAAITVNAVNDLPASSDIARTTDEDMTLTFAASDFTDAFSNVDGHTLKSVKVVTLPDAAHGVLTVGAANPPAKVQAGGVIAAADLGTLKFVPAANWNGSASFTFKVTDSSDEESAAPATAAITVNAVNDLPASSDIAKTTGEDTTLAFAASDFTDAFSDVDGHTLKSVKVVTLPNAAHGVLTVGTADPPAEVQAGGVIAAADLGTLKFVPVANWTGSTSFTFRVIDSSDGESAASATAAITVNAKVGGVTVSSSAGTDSAYAIGETISLTATFSGAVTVTAAGSDPVTGPRIPFTLGNATKHAVYASGSGTKALVFSYTVAEGDEDTDGIAVGADALELNGGRIEDGSGSAAALTHAAVAADAAHTVDGVRPTVESALVDGATLTLTFDEALDTTTAPDKSAFTVSGTAAATSVTGVAFDTNDATKVELTVSPAVAADDTGITLGYTVPSGAGANPLEDVPGNAAAAFTGRSVSNAAVAAVTGVEVSSTAGDDDTYAIGDTIALKAAFSRSVTVTTAQTAGTVTGPRIAFTLGDATKHAVYASGSGTKALVFHYTVAAGDEDTDGVAVGVDALALNGGRIDDGASNAATLTHAAVAASTDHKVDGVRPTVDAASVAATTLTLTFDEPLGTAANLANASFTVKRTRAGAEQTVSLSGTVAPAISARTVTLTLADAVVATDTGVKVSYTVPATGTDNALADAVGNAVAAFTDAAVANASGPTVVVSSTAGTDSTYAIGDAIALTATFSGAVTVTEATSGGAVTGPRIAFTVGSATRHAVYASGSGTKALVFRYTVAEGDEDTDGIAVGVDALELNGGAIDDEAGSAATLAHAAVAASTAHQVDGVRPTVSSAEVDGTTLTITFDEALGAAASLANASFTVKRTRAGAEQTVSLSVTVAPAISARTVTLTLTDAVVATDSGVKVSYTVPTTGTGNKLVDGVGNAVAAFTDQSVANASGPTVVVSSTAGTDSTYAIGEAIALTATFSGTVTVTEATSGGAVVGPRIAFALGDATKHAVYASGSGTKALVFDYTVAEGDEDTDGIAVGVDALELNGGAIDDEAGSAAALTHAAVAADAAHTVDGVRPTVESALVDGATLTLTFDESLDTTTAPDKSAFTVSGTAAATSVTGVAFDADDATKVELTVSPAVGAGESGVEVGYTRPSAHPLEDVPGNALAAFSAQAVSNAPSAPSAPTVAAASSTSLTVNWSAPSALGSASSITDYDLRYYAGSSAPANEADWIEEGETDGPPDPGSSTTATITGLTANTTYQVQVRAFGDLESPWSAAGSGKTADTASPGGALVSNADYVGTSGSDVRTAQSFTTGSRGATISEIQLRTASSTSGSISVRLRADDSGVPGDLVAEFTNPSSIAADAFNSFTAPADTTVDANTTYWVSVFEGVSSRLTLRLASSNAETGETGWAIGDGRKYRTSDSGSWQDASNTLVMVVKGTLEAASTTAPSVTGVAVSSAAGADSTYAIGETISLTATFNESVTVTTAQTAGVVVGPRIAFTVGDATRHAVYASGTGTKALVFHYTVAEGDEDTDGIAVGVDALALNGGAIDDEAGSAATLTHAAVAASTDHKVDGVRPTVESAEVDGTTLTITFDEALGAAASLANASFTVKKTPAGDSEQTVSLSGTVAPAISARTVTLTLTDAVAATDTGVKVSYTVPATGTDNALADAVGNAVAAFTDQSVANASGPTVVVSSTAGTDSTYAIGEAIALTATFSGAVTVTTATSGGAVVGPRIAFTVGSATKHAVYASGSGTKALVFHYTVAEGDEDSDGIAVGVDALELNGGAIDDASSNAATLTHAAVAGDTAHQVDGVRPTLDGATVSATTLTLTFDETLGTAASLANASFTVKKTPQGGAEQTVSLSGTVAPAISARTVTLTLTDAVVATDTGVKVSYTVPTTGTGNKLVDGAGNAAAAFTDQSVTNASGPTVVVSSTAGTDSTYAIGDAIALTATFSGAVTVTTATSGGAVVGPRIALTVGSATRHAVYASGSGTKALVFHYTVAEGDEDTDGIAVGADALALNGGAIDDASSNAAVLTHAAVAASTDHKVDGVRPTVESALVDGVTLTLTFDEALDTAAAPDKSAFTVSGTAAAASVTGVAFDANDATKVELTVSPAVAADETGITLGYSPPSGAGASPLEDVPGNAVAAFTGRSVTNAAVAAVTALEVSSTAGDDDTYAIGDTIALKAAFSRSVTVTTAETAGVVEGPRIAFTVGDATRHAVYASGSGTKALVFHYTVAAGDEDTDGIAVGADALALNGGAIDDASSNAATLTHAAVAASTDHKVDGVRPTVESAVVDGTTLTLTFDESLDTAAAPDKSAFTVSGTAAATSVTGVAFDANDATKVELTVSPAVGAGESGVEVGYTRPSAHPLEDVPGNAVAAFSAQAVSNAPSAPSAPTVAAASSTSLTVNWSAPSALGSASSITDYDLRYYAGSSAPANEADWIEEGETDGPPDPGSSTTATITGLTANTTYQVQVRAFGDLESPWSAAGSGKTADTASPGGALVSNADYVGTSGSDVRTAQSFTTGSRGATISEIQLRTASSTSGSISVRLRADDSGVPGDLVAEFTNPSSIAADAFNSFTAPADTTVDANTTYWVSVFEGVSSRLTLRLASSNAETGETGWAIGDGRKYRTSDSGSWQDASNTLVMVVKGTLEAASTTAPSVTGVAVSSAAGADSTYAIGETISLTATFNESVTVTTAQTAGVVVGPRIAFTVGDATKHAVYASGTGTKALVFHYTVAEGDEDTDGIAVGVDALALNGGAIDDGASNAAALAHAAVSASTAHTVDGVRPTLDAASVAATTLTLTFDEALGAAASLANGSFTVKRTRAGSEQTVSLSGTPAISGATVSLTLSAAVTATDTAVKVSYAVPTTGSANRLVDAAGNTAAAFTDTTVTNATGPALTSLAVSSDAGTDSTYAIGDTIALKATFNVAVTVDTSAGTPRIAFTLGTATKHAAYASGSTTKELEFRYTVAEGDADSDGIAVAANALALNGGAIADGSGNAATLDHTALAAQSAHKVDGERPTLKSASVSGTTLTLTFDEALGAAASLANTAFTVKRTRAGTEETVSLSGTPSISDTTVSLTWPRR